MSLWGNKLRLQCYNNYIVPQIVVYVTREIHVEVCTTQSFGQVKLSTHHIRKKHSQAALAPSASSRPALTSIIMPRA